MRVTQQNLRPLRVLMVTPRYFPFMGGVETHIYEVGRRLTADGIEVGILTCDPKGDLPLYEEMAGMLIHRVRSYPSYGDLCFAPAIAGVIGAGAWDVVHCQSYHTFVAPLAMLAAWRKRVPYVVTFHSGGHSSSWRNAIRQTQRQMLRPLFARASRLIGVSEFEAATFRDTLHLPPEQFVVIPNGGKLPEVVNVTPRATDDPNKLILAVGRLEKYKGHQRVIAAMPTVLRRYPDARLVIVGGGPYEAQLRRQITDLRLGDHVSIRSIPANERQTMAQLLAGADLITLFSDYEAHPIAVMEAIAMGKPVLGTATSGLQELAQKAWIRCIPLNATPDAAGAAIIAQLTAPLIPPPVAVPTWDECAQALENVYLSVVPNACAATSAASETVAYPIG